ncbi:isoprenylcysteine carboxylmethyltransferase family protein [Pseudoalteromonas sp. C2R02]|uniref:methyltransferase family protein n=1 Tax=Pseudoalteromonas sp. C2R02 TaxID=2841565 RepID=UPI001C08ED9D|nr:isoprenylcysteine carboxylmethyltransferase family protein [Pseudoalteromonas sp. C2R02]MBU2970844.1 isoprenylcysteine carboxylmethyltransferase family protein [Pseudoalteromonas sp. C2R02]
MDKFKNRVPPPIVMLIFAVLMWGISQISINIEMSYLIRMLSLLTLILFGMLFCIAGVVSFKLAKTTTNPLKPEAATSLVVSGIYKYSRNPMYLGFALFLLAWSVYLASMLSILGVVVFVCYMNQFQIMPEEAALNKVFGDEFEQYKSKVRRWL